MLEPGKDLADLDLPCHSLVPRDLQEVLSAEAQQGLLDGAQEDSRSLKLTRKPLKGVVDGFGSWQKQSQATKLVLLPELPKGPHAQSDGIGLEAGPELHERVHAILDGVLLLDQVEVT